MNIEKEIRESIHSLTWDIIEESLYDILWDHVNVSDHVSDNVRDTVWLHVEVCVDNSIRTIFDNEHIIIFGYEY